MQNSFDSFVTSFEPFPWTVVENHTNSWLVGNNAILINYNRFKLIAGALKNYFRDEIKIFDVGVYPGTVPQIFKESIAGESPYTYTGVGLGFSEEFSKEMAKINVDLLECDLDPRINQTKNRKNNFKLESEYDICVFTDVIEHFFDPFYPLTEINKNLKIEGILILTTDNITHYANTLSFLKGKSPNVPLINGNLFYDGDWRPHFREFSKGEIEQLLKWAGFEIIHHEFYEAEFGNYKIQDGAIKRFEYTGNSIKNILKRFFRNTLKSIFPHLRDNHFVIAKKVSLYEEMLKSAPKLTSDVDEWMNQRKRF